MLKKYSGNLYCFSPPIMLLTFALEFGLAVYVIWRYKLNKISRLVLVFLVSLGVFQLSEYMICGGLGLNHAGWVQLGYVAITLLPALGMHIVATLAKKSVRPLIFAAYATALAYALYFIVFGSQVISSQCTPNYAIFDLSNNGYLFYGSFYYGWLILTASLAIRWARQLPTRAAALRWMVTGYAVFIVPTTVANLIDPATVRAIPSIMCGFAILFAIILVWRVIPLARVPTIER